MPREKIVSKTANADPSYVRMYYEHQYDRINKHQEQSLNVSNLVLTISTLVMTFGFNNQSSLGSISIIFLPLIMIVVNLFAILFIAFVERAMLQHRERARRVLEIYASELLAIDNEAPIFITKREFSRRKIQNLIHYLFILIAVVMFILFLLEKLNVFIP
jgi:hypothetical protein